MWPRGSMLICLSLFRPCHFSLPPRRAGLSGKVASRGHLPPSRGSPNGGATDLGTHVPSSHVWKSLSSPPPRAPPALPSPSSSRPLPAQSHLTRSPASPTFSLPGSEPVVLVSDMAAIAGSEAQLSDVDCKGTGCEVPGAHPSRQAAVSGCGPPWLSALATQALS